MKVMEKIKALMSGTDVEEQNSKFFQAERNGDAGIQELDSAIIADRESSGEEVLAGWLDGRTDALTRIATREGLTYGKRQGLLQGIDAARRARRESWPSLMEFRAKKLRDEAAAVEVAKADLLAKIEPLVTKLKELTGALYIPEAPHHDGAYRDPRVWIMPKQDELQGRIDELNSQALIVQNQRFVDSGNTNASTIDELVNLACWINPERLGPAAWRVREWASSAMAKATPGYEPKLNNRPVVVQFQFVLVWRGGGIVEAESSCRSTITSEYADVPQVAA